jgi:uncharacterized membrane protein YdjX (TVP38/TMEM64 family)
VSDRVPRSVWPRRALAIAAALVVAFVAWSAWDRDALLRFRDEAHPLRFLAATAILPAIGVPISSFFLFAGAAFGRALGVGLSLGGLGLNLALCYALSRVLRPLIGAAMRSFGYELPDFAARETGSLRFTFAVKAAPGVPAFVKHYGLGVAGVPFAVYFGVSMLMTGVYAVSLVLLGQSLLQHRGDRAAWLLAVLAGAGLAAWWWRRQRRRRSGPS